MWVKTVQRINLWEHLAACYRAIPGLYVFRPGDANEVLESYRAIMQLDRHPRRTRTVASKHSDL